MQMIANLMKELEHTGSGVGRVNQLYGKNSTKEPRDYGPHPVTLLHRTRIARVDSLTASAYAKLVLYIAIGLTQKLC